MTLRGRFIWSTFMARFVAANDGGPKRKRSGRRGWEVGSGGRTILGWEEEGLCWLAGCSDAIPKKSGPDDGALGHVFSTSSTSFFARPPLLPLSKYNSPGFSAMASNMKNLTRRPWSYDDGGKSHCGKPATSNLIISRTQGHYLLVDHRQLPCQPLVLYCANLPNM